MYQPLAPCPSCDRHVRTTDATCPFCDARLTSEHARSAVPGTTTRLSRGAAYIFASTLAVAGCGSTVAGTDATPGADVAQGSDAQTAPDNVPPTADVPQQDDVPLGTLYGGPVPVVDAGAPDDNGGGSADYGAPPPRDN